MGLISDALKRAEQERRNKSQSAPIQAHSADDPQPIAPNDVVDLPPGLAAALSDDKHSAISAPEWNPQPAGGVSAFHIHESVVAFHDKAAEITEEYRSLRARLTAMNTTGENQVIAITSSIPKEGKSVTTMNLAWVISEIKHFRVLMIDADFRRSSLASMTGISEYPGLADLLRGEARLEEVIRPTPVPNLHVIPAGTTQEFNAAELLSTQRTATVLQECKRRYQFCIVDTPPASTVSDASVIGPLCTGVLFIVRMGTTPEPIAKSTIRLLQSNNVNILGCILAGHRKSAGRYRRYYYGYHKYYSDPY